MLNPQIRGILGVLLILIPIGAVSFGLLSIQNPETIISLPSEQHPFIPPNYMRYVIASSDVPPVHPPNYLAQSFIVTKEYQSIDSIHLALMTNDYGNLDEWQEITIYIVEGNSLDEFESGQNSQSPITDPVLRGTIRVMDIPNMDTFTHKSLAIDRFTKITITQQNKELLLGHFYYIYIPKEEWRTSTFRGWVAWVRTIDTFSNGYAWYSTTSQTGNWIREDSAKDFSFKIVGTPKTEQPEPPEEKGWIDGTVYKYHGSGVVLVGATVTANGYTTTTNSLGKYSLEVNVGTYTIMVSKDGYYSSEIGDISISDGQTSTQDFYLELIPDGIDTGVVSGYVYKEDSTTTISNVNIIATKGGDIITDITDSNGYYSLTLPIGNWVIKANKTGYYDSFETITVSEIPLSQGFYLGKIPTSNGNGNGDEEEDEDEDEDVVSAINWNMLIFTTMMIAIGVVFLLSCITMNIIILFIGFAGSALAWILYNTSIGGLF